MRTRLLAGMALSMALAAPALAQSTQPTQPAPTGTNGPTASTTGGGLAIRSQVKRDLEHAGFTNVQIMPESFLVRATDQHGHPVMMVINPDSVMAVTSLSANTNGNTASGNTTASASNGTSGTTSGSSTLGTAGHWNTANGQQTGSSASTSGSLGSGSGTGSGHTAGSQTGATNGTTSE